MARSVVRSLHSVASEDLWAREKKTITHVRSHSGPGAVDASGVTEKVRTGIHGLTYATLHPQAVGQSLLPYCALRD